MNNRAVFSRLPFFGLTGPRVATFWALNLCAAFFDGFGMAMFLPVLEFVEKGRDIGVLAGTSKMWDMLIATFSLVGIEVGLLSLLAVAVGMMLLRVFFVYVRQVYTAWLSNTVLHVVRTKLFDSYLGMDYGAYAGHSSGAIINMLTVEAQRVGGGFNSMLALVSNSVVVLGFLAVLLWLSVPMTVLAALFLGIAGAVVLYYVRHTVRCSKAVHRANDAYSRVALERLGAFRLLKLTVTALREAARVRKASGYVRDTNYWMSKLQARVDLFLEPLVLVAGGGILYLSVSAFGMSLSQLGLFMLVLLRLLPLCKELLRSRQAWKGIQGSLDAVLGDLEWAGSNKEPGGGSVKFPGLSRGIRLKNVTFTYPGADSPALSGVDMEFPVGRITALVGPSGAGKTTMADIIPRLRVPLEGRVLYDGVDGAEFDLASLRRGMAFVSQDAAVLDDSVAGNLRFARPEATDDEIWDALERARAKEFVQALPNGLETRLGERGVMLSGGQKQRLSLARALLQDTGVLILDEPTSALDSETERDIQRVIDGLRDRGEATIIIIAHRLSTIRGADQIVVLDGGRIVEQGTHEELMVSEDWYARVCGMQDSGIETGA